VPRPREVTELLTANLDRLRSLPWDELDSYGTRRSEVAGASGRRYTVTTYTFWDMEPWASGMYVIVKVRPRRGWRRFLAYKESDVLLVPSELHRDARASG
jgi:hypothetical protein